MSTPLVILWWGPDIRILGGAGRIAAFDLAAGQDPVAGCLGLADREFPGGGRARIIYQPDTLELHEVACPRTTRARLRRILAADFPALAVPATVWGAEPILASPRGYATLLHLDPVPRLSELAEGLAARGFRVEGAWPLLPLVGCVPPPGAAGATLSLIATARRLLIAGSTSTGRRFCSSLSQGDPSGSLRAVRHALARFEDGEKPSGWLVLEEGPASEPLRAAAAELAPAEAGFGDFLGRARLLIPGGPADLMPRPRLSWKSRTGRRLWVAAGCALMVATAAAVGVVHRHRERSRRLSAEEEIHRSEAAGRLASETRIRESSEEVATAIARAETTAQPHHRLLLALARSVPDSAELHSLTVDGRDFAIAGRFDPRSGQGLPAAIVRDLGAPGAPWRIQAGPPAGAGAEFVIRGAFLSPDPPLAPAKGGSAADDLRQREARLAGICAALPPASDLEQSLKAWRRGGTIEMGASGHFRGFEIRQCTLTIGEPQGEDWDRVLDTVRALCGEPGLSIERLALTADEEGRIRGVIGFTFRLKP